MVDTHLIQLEDEIQDGHYVIRAELPGIDPAKDIDVTVTNGPLTIKLERSERTESTDRSEFSYGSFARSVTLPTGANEDDISASYDKGILTVSVTIPEAPPAEKHIPVQAGKLIGAAAPEPNTSFGAAHRVGEITTTKALWNPASFAT